VIGLAVAAAAGAKKLARRNNGGLAASFGAGGRSPAGVLEILGRYPLARGQSLVLLRMDRRILLLSHTTGGRLGRSTGLSTLCDTADAEEVASIIAKTRDDDGDSLAAKFQGMLATFEQDPADTDEAELTGRREFRSSDRDCAQLLDDTAPPHAPGPLASLRRCAQALRDHAIGESHA
ncbi:MAG: flagellar biosynthetic protein FliO, partial [Phycisphaerales bacterium]|nr:flagellar biosynthetic protein FliO [Phycisphaerales bacterium]